MLFYKSRLLASKFLVAETDWTIIFLSVDGVIILQHFEFHVLVLLFVS